MVKKDDYLFAQKIDPKDLRPLLYHQVQFRNLDLKVPKRILFVQIENWSSVGNPETILVPEVAEPTLGNAYVKRNGSIALLPFWKNFLYFLVLPAINNGVPERTGLSGKGCVGFRN